MDDERIIQLFFARDEEALSALKEKYGGLCRKIAYNITRSSPDAEEVVSDAYLGVWRSIPPNHPDPLLPYVARIVRNLAFKKTRYNGAVKRKNAQVPYNELEECLPAACRTQDDFDGEELTRLLNAFLGGLDRTTRIAFVRRYWYCDPVKEIATALGMRAHTLTVRLARTRERLAVFLSEEGILL